MDGLAYAKALWWERPWHVFLETVKSVLAEVRVAEKGLVLEVEQQTFALHHA